jgi:hypothetical protein
MMLCVIGSESASGMKVMWSSTSVSELESVSLSESELGGVVCFLFFIAFFLAAVVLIVLLYWLFFDLAT